MLIILSDENMQEIITELLTIDQYFPLLKYILKNSGTVFICVSTNVYI